MAGSIELYVRPASHGPIINIYVPIEFRDRFIRAIGETGSISSDDVPIYFEMTVLQDWTDQALEGPIGPHVKVAAESLNVIFQD